MADISTLDESHADDVVRLAARSIGEIPLYQWLLGPHVDEADMREWLAGLILRPLLRVGCVTGGWLDGTLVGLLAWQPHDVNLSPDGTPPLTPDDVAVAARTPGLRERLLTLWTSQPLPLPVEDAVNVVLAVVDEGDRGGRVLIDMMSSVEEFCHANDRPFYAWTGSPPLRDWLCALWDGKQFDTAEWGGRMMYGMMSDRPPAAVRIPRRHAAS
ncbi:hypothetical protein [Gordonia aichiensis]|uniref:hypothetical protein n=1 Tax=Gordonia aichiensis TaxID=36820 RepID=UPI0032630D9A